MPWYKSGLVSVTLNSNAVIGTGTAFIANSRVGDGFRGPDGGWYEVTNIASDTAMSISPVYKGATNPAGAYALAPMQGYVKDSADALRALVNTYGAKLAALGTTGNYEVLPLSKGGTGATTDAGARTALGLGNLGLTSPVVLNGVDLNTVITGLFYYVAGSTNAPAPNGWLSVQPVNASYCAQRFINESTGVVSERTLLGGVWGGWTSRAKTGVNSDITSLTGMTTALSVAQGGTGNTTGTATKLAGGGILGTVSQSAGVPNGTIFESGSNSLGTYVKFADGTMITITYNTGPWSVLANSLTVLGPFGNPGTFVNSVYSVAVTAAPSATNDTYGVVTAYPASTSSAIFVFRNGATAQNLSNIKITCIGRWY